MVVDFGNIRTYWDSHAAAEEHWLQVRSISRELRQREVAARLEGIDTILDIGGGTGAFSIPLAQQGFSVTHLDLSPAMLAIARQKARGIENIRFVEGNAVDLSRFQDRSFDLVLNMDGPISGSGDDAERVIVESVRVTRRVLIAAVAHRAWLTAVLAAASLTATGKLLPEIYSLLDCGPGEAPYDITKQFGLAAMRTFSADELRGTLERAGMRILRIGGVGSLESLCEEATLNLVKSNEFLFKEFVELCDQFDKRVLPDGSGAPNDTGLVCTAEHLNL